MQRLLSLVLSIAFCVPMLACSDDDPVGLESTIYGSYAMTTFDG